MESEQLLTQSQIFEDKILARSECTKDPAEEVPKPNHHGKNITETPSHALVVRLLTLRVYDVLMTTLDQQGNSQFV